MALVAAVWIVEDLLDGLAVLLGRAEVVHGGGDIAEYVVDGSVHFVSVYHACGLGVTDSKPTLPQLCNTVDDDEKDSHDDDNTNNYNRNIIINNSGDGNDDMEEEEDDSGHDNNNMISTVIMMVRLTLLLIQHIHD